MFGKKINRMSHQETMPFKRRMQFMRGRGWGWWRRRMFAQAKQHHPEGRGQLAHMQPVLHQGEHRGGGWRSGIRRMFAQAKQHHPEAEGRGQLVHIQPVLHQGEHRGGGWRSGIRRMFAQAKHSNQALVRKPYPMHRFNQEAVRDNVEEIVKMASQLPVIKEEMEKHRVKDVWTEEVPHRERMFYQMQQQPHQQSRVEYKATSSGIKEVKVTETQKPKIVVGGSNETKSVGISAPVVGVQNVSSTQNQNRSSLSNIAPILLIGGGAVLLILMNKG